MNREEFCEQIKPHVEKYIDGFYDEKFEGANIRQILNIAEQYSQLKVSEQLAEKDAEIERLKEKIEVQSKLYFELIELKGATEYPPLESLELIRSFISISEREGKDTNWGAFNMQCRRIIELTDKKDEFTNKTNEAL